MSVSNFEDFTFKFGKYRNISVLKVIGEDPQYCEWIIHQPDFEKKNKDLFNYMLKNNVKYDKDYLENKKKKLEYKKEYFTFGKYKNKRIEEVFEENKDYCIYISKLDNVIKFHKPTVETIDNLIKADISNYL